MEEAERERLRRSLYRRGATEADRARYVESAPAAEAAPKAPPRPRPPVSVRAGVAAALLVAGTAAVALTTVPADPTAAVSAGASLPAAATPPAVERTPWQPDVQQVSTTYTDAGVVQAFHGRGPATAVLDDDVMPHDGGRLSVVLAPSTTASIGWEVRRHVPVDGASDQLIAQRSATERTGVAMPIVFPFDGDPPTTVRVQAPDDVGWSLVVSSLRGATAR